jgi:DNA-binding SARP family transcriptional activator
VEFCVLGPFEVRNGEEALPAGRPRDRALLAVLALHPGRLVSLESLLDALWDGEPPPTAIGSIHNGVSRLRRLLGPGVLLTQANGYLLSVDDEAVDATRFRKLVDSGASALEQGRPAEAAARLREADGLWRGPALAGIDAPFASLEAARLGELRIHAVEQRIEAELALGRHHVLVPELEALVDSWPLRERLRAQLMLALYRSGRQPEALAVYARTRRHLSDEFGLEPSSELQRLEQAILRHDPSLERRFTSPPEAAVAPSRRQRLRVRAGTLVLVAAAAAAGYALGMRGSHAVGAPVDRKTHPIGDDFGDGFRGPLWRKIVHGQGIDVDERNGRVEATIVASARDDPRTHGFDAQFSSLCTYPGNFDVQIDYDLLDWPRANGVRIWLGAFYVLDDPGQWIARESTKTGERYAALIPSELTERSTTDRKGTLRLDRSGGIMTASFRDGSTWAPLGVGPAETKDTIVYFNVASDDRHFGDRPIRVAWDNFRVNSGTPTCTTGDTTPPGS